jgi:multiple sugar transport system substrate-binding protein
VTRLRGMTWSHPRGFDPLVACARLWREKTGVEIAWEQRSLQDFESYPVEDLARRYDLIVIDHPHVGQVVREGCLLPLDRPERASDLARLAGQSVGPSFESYRHAARLWALPVDAATQVQAFRPDLISAPARSWETVLELARTGRVLCPLRPPHSLMVFYSLAANLGCPCAREGPGRLIDVERGAAVYERMHVLAAAIDPACFALDPIAVFERMAAAESAIACAPLIYGYVSYAIAGFRPARLAFADIPVAGAKGPVGSALGGTGVAVSARSTAPEAAIAFAFWVASDEVQRGPYAEAGGQPGNAAAWEDEAVNAAAGDFYRATRATLDGAWVRPRHDGYMVFQDSAAKRLNQALQHGETARRVVEDLNAMFGASFRPIRGDDIGSHTGSETQLGG